MYVLRVSPPRSSTRSAPRPSSSSPGTNGRRKDYSRLPEPFTGSTQVQRTSQDSTLSHWYDRNLIRTGEFMSLFTPVRDRITKQWTRLVKREHMELIE